MILFGSFYSLLRTIWVELADSNSTDELFVKEEWDEDISFMYGFAHFDDDTFYLAVCA